MIETFDAIVLGLGGFGSSVLYHLARRGARVLGIEQFCGAHQRGSSHGQTRIIRKAYFEHPNYVPLLQLAYELWSDLEQSSGRSLLVPSGLFLSGRPDTEAIAGTLRAAREHGLPVEQLSPGDARRRFPGFEFPGDFLTLFERQAGFLEVESCVQAHLDAARALGARIHFDEAVQSFSARGSGVQVLTSRSTHQAARLVVTAGPWADVLLRGVLGGRLRVLRKPVFWFPAPRHLALSAGTPAFFFDVPWGQFYGFPRIDGNCLKVAEHTGGDAVPDPAAVDRRLHPRDLAGVERFLRAHLPGVSPRPAAHSICLYTMSPDQHFLVDWHPRHRQIVLGAGFSGHGFKFTSVLGKAMADMALDGQTSLPVAFLALSRLADGGG